MNLWQVHPLLAGAPALAEAWRREDEGFVGQVLALALASIRG